MSFSDVGRRSGNTTVVSGGGPVGYNQNVRTQQQTVRRAAPHSTIENREAPTVVETLNQISDWLRQFQQNLLILDRLGDTVGTDPDPGDEFLRQVAAQQDVVSELASTVRRALNDLPRRIEALPRIEQGRPKAAMAKLRKDFERVGSDLRRVLDKIKNARRLALTNARAEKGGSLSGQASTASSQQMNGSNLYSRSANAAVGAPHRVGRAQFGPSDAPGDLDVVIGNQRVQLQVAMQEEAINDAILREREEEIREINQSVHKVNEIFRDLALIVDKQQTEVDQIGDLVEKSHNHAEKGLDQVQKAAKLQPTCLIS
uniref:t-SNARE coiled-coil homology domain-containing protein n=1 Tax=Aureoumbra lagunensis TaxID=44058 RepID=A0A7S3JXJ1_9STRA